MSEQPKYELDASVDGVACIYDDAGGVVCDVGKFDGILIAALINDANSAEVLRRENAELVKVMKSVANSGQHAEWCATGRTFPPYGCDCWLGDAKALAAKHHERAEQS